MDQDRETIKKAFIEKLSELNKIGSIINYEVRGTTLSVWKDRLNYVATTSTKGEKGFEKISRGFFNFFQNNVSNIASDCFIKEIDASGDICMKVNNSWILIDEYLPGGGFNPQLSTEEFKTSNIDKGLVVYFSENISHITFSISFSRIYKESIQLQDRPRTDLQNLPLKFLICFNEIIYYSAVLNGYRDINKLQKISENIDRLKGALIVESNVLGSGMEGIKGILNVASNHLGFELNAESIKSSISNLVGSDVVSGVSNLFTTFKSEVENSEDKSIMGLISTFGSTMQRDEVKSTISTVLEKGKEAISTLASAASKTSEGPKSAENESITEADEQS